MKDRMVNMKHFCISRQKGKRELLTVIPNVSVVIDAAIAVCCPEDDPPMLWITAPIEVFHGAICSALYSKMNDKKSILSRIVASTEVPYGAVFIPLYA